MVKEEESIVLFLLLYLDFCTSTKKRNGNLKKQLHFVVWAWQLMHCSQYWTFKFGSQIDRTIAVLQFPENLTFWMKFMVGLFWIDCLCKKKITKKNEFMRIGKWSCALFYCWFDYLSRMSLESFFLDFCAWRVVAIFKAFKLRWLCIGEWKFIYHGK